MTDRAGRLEQIRALQAERDGTTVIAYITSTRPNLEGQMAMDALPIIYRHLTTIETAPADTKIDLFLHTNGGDGVVPWKLVTLLRERCSELTVLVPHRAYSAGTLTALGADRVIMHQMAMLGPTDPTVTNPFNPTNPQNPDQLLGISVEDVSSYVSLVKDDVGIRHEDELVRAFALLAEKVHPLALGNVKRATAQSRMLGEKLLRQRKREPLDERDIPEIIEKLTSQLYFHGHPINRDEAINDLRLRFVESPSEAVETDMWALYESYVDEMLLDRPFDVLAEALEISPISLPPPPQMVGPGQLAPTTVNVATTALPSLTSVFIESEHRADAFQFDWEVTVRREWTGATAAEILTTASGWVEQT